MPSSSAGEAPDASSSLRPRLVWVTAFRTAAATLLLAVYGVRLLSRPSSETLAGEDLLSLWMVGCIYLLVLVQALFLRNSKPGARSALVHVAGDVAIATVLVFLTGGPESPFTFTYLLVVVGASILLGQWGALAAAAACSVSFLVLAAAVSSGTIHTPVPVGTLSVGRLAFLCASNVLAQFLTAVLTGFLARQLTTAGGRLSARERDLRELTRLQQQILAAMPSGLLTCDVDGRITYVNRAARQILGIDPVGTPASVEELIPGVRTHFTGKPRSEVTVTTPAGRRILGLTVSALSAPPAPLLVVFQDLTELRRAEQELRRADRLAELGALSAQLAHEIRNPLAAMRGSAQLLSPGADPDTERLVGILTREADRLGELVTDFLAFARPPAPVLRPCDLDELVRQTIELLSSDPLASGVNIEVEPGGLRAEVDPDQVRQVLLNLLAQRAGRRGERRASPDLLQPRGRPGADPRLGLRGEHRHHRPAAHLRAVLHQAPGRHRARAVHRAHHRPGPRRADRGQLLPWRRHRVRGGVRRPGERGRPSVKILVVDDEPSMRQYLEVLLSRSGYEVLTAPGVAQARDVLGSGQVDLVVSDMRLGKDSGLEVLKQARSRESPPEVILITAYGTPASAVEAMRQGAYDYICKPFDNEELKLLVQKALEKRTLRQENQQLWQSLSEHSLSMVGRSTAMEAVRALVRKVAAEPLDGADRGRERHRQGAGRPGDPPCVPAGRPGRSCR